MAIDTDAGTDQSVLVGSTVQLDASGSSDVDGDLLAVASVFGFIVAYIRGLGREIELKKQIRNGLK